MIELPKQGEFHELAANTRTKADCEYYEREFYARARAVMDKQFESCDIVVAFGDSSLCIYSSGAGE